MTSLTTLIFDFDGTIADTFAFLLETAHEWIPGEHFDYLADKPLESLRDYALKDILKELKIPFYKLPSLVTLARNHISKSIEKIPLIPGMDRALAQLHQDGYHLGIVTSNGKQNTQNFLNHHQLSYFDFIHSGKHLFGKHHILKRVIKAHHLSPQHTIYVGDEVRDIEAAHKAGLPIISVSWGLNTPVILQTAHPDYLINKPDQLLPQIKKHFE